MALTAMPKAWNGDMALTATLSCDSMWRVKSAVRGESTISCSVAVLALQCESGSGSRCGARQCKRGVARRVCVNTQNMQTMRARKCRKCRKCETGLEVALADLDHLQHVGLRVAGRHARLVLEPATRLLQVSVALDARCWCWLQGPRWCWCWLARPSQLPGRSTLAQVSSAFFA